MNKLHFMYVIFSYLAGFVLFTFVMDIFRIDKMISGLFENKNTESLGSKMINNGEIVSNNEKDFLKKSEEFTVLKTEDSKKPLKLSKEEIGRHTWALLHSVAASYPSVPSEENKKDVENFLHSLSKVYPCKICATHFKKMLEDFPIKHKSREELVYYLCGLHNKVNERLGKKIYPCKQSFEIWGGDCGCEVSE